MNKITKAGLVAIAIMITLLGGYAIGFTHCQDQWEKQVWGQIELH